MKNNLNRTSAALIGAVALVFSLAACSPSGPETLKEDSVAETTESQAPQNGSEYPAQVRDNFVSSCSSQAGASEELCGKCFEVVTETFTFEEFMALETAIASGTATEEDNAKLTAVLDKCVA
ncbi:hypothetical protein QBL02_12850 [Leucobacter sp. UT-8R-CII-1-4]|uniref:hypothetical protein n=1 Tax=Leucobacter sp. UT-8R-CII-1-4 TaxID=3040075 RepID=UPI0024A81873|nr:hypothetical protein [Leucobacter sp. UT-8R-CII-1-4]MDI6024430.1 hypothetical protein [Leucobacter sp. UT-8R-CII-1-4]